MFFSTFSNSGNKHVFFYRCVVINDRARPRLQPGEAKGALTTWQGILKVVLLGLGLLCVSIADMMLQATIQGMEKVSWYFMELNTKGALDYSQVKIIGFGMLIILRQDKLHWMLVFLCHVSGVSLEF